MWFGCLVFATLALISGLDRMAATGPTVAAHLPPIIAVQGLDTQGQKLIASDDGADGLALATRMVARAPVEPVATALLGAARLATNDPAGADRAFRVAGQLGWRVPLAQVYWYDRALELGDYRVAGERLDALLRQNPALLASRPLLDPMERDPRGRVAIVDRLVARPDWLSHYVQDVTEISNDALLLRAQVLKELNGRGVQLGCDMVAPLIRRLSGDGDGVEAAALWRRNCREASGGMIADSHFDALSLGTPRTPFEWEVIGNSDIAADFEPRDGRPRLVASSTSEHVRPLLRQLVVAPSGKYRLAWRARDAAGHPSTAILATVSCSPDAAGWLRPTLDSSGDSTTSVTINGDCPAHWLAFGIVPGAQSIALEQVALEPAR